MDTLYKDKLIEITDTELVLHHYHFPSGSDRRVALSDIESVHVKPPTLLNGQWRLWGTGDFKTWFPNDGRRPQRDRIFLLRLRKSARSTPWLTALRNSMSGKAFRYIGFTAEDSQKVIDVLEEKGLLEPN